MENTTIQPALDRAQWKDLNGPMFFYGTLRPDGSSFVYFDGDGEGISVSLACKTGNPEQEKFPIQLPEEDRHALAALALHGQPFGFQSHDVTWLRAIAENTRDDLVQGFLRSLADRIAALVPPDE